jgi:hypothetical protein
MIRNILYKRIIYILIVLMLFEWIFLPSAVAGEESVVIQNIHFDQSGNIVTIYYDLNGPVDKSYKVTIKLKSEDYKSFEYLPQNVTGDIGEGNFVGINRKIVWNLIPESPPISAQYKFYFEVKAEMLSSPISPYLWVGGAVVLGGIAALLFSGGSSEVPTNQSHLPLNPPGRP